MPIEFGRIESVNLRAVCPHEADDFTPWLADNLSYISNAVGIPLELVETETYADGFYADILARDRRDGSVALIENQLEGSDHTHLGQILTYLASLEARTVIWVAREFDNAHLAAIHWLNENTLAQFSFFAIRVEVVKIGDSLPVPQFVVLERPGERDGQVQGATQSDGDLSLAKPLARAEQVQGATQSGGDLSATGRFNRDFWTHYADLHPNDGVRRGFAGYNPQYRVPGTDFTIRRYHAARNQVGVWVITPESRTFRAEQPRVKPYLPALAKELGIDPSELDSSAFINAGVDISNPNNWTAAADWLHEVFEIYRRILSQPPRAC